jgi:L-proline amide hydrolase
MKEDSTVYNVMNGPNEFHVIGTMKDWSVVDQIDQIIAPTLLVSGRYDEATPAVVQPFMDKIPDVRWVIFEESSHMPFVEEPEAYFSVVEAFLAEHD